VIEAGVWVLPGLPDDTITVHLGFGRAHAGSTGTGAGFSAYRLRSSSAPWFQSGLTIVRSGRRTKLASTQHHAVMENRNLVRTGTLAGQLAPIEEHGAEPHGRVPLSQRDSLHPAHEYLGNRWGMVIDLTTC